MCLLLPVCSGCVRLRAGVHLGGDGKEILIDPLISGLRQGEGARELQSTWEKAERSAIKTNKKEREKITGEEWAWETGDVQKNDKRR